MIYKHYKGGLYRALLAAKDSTTLETAMVYVSLETGEVWVRPSREFSEVVRWPDGKKRKL